MKELRLLASARSKGKTMTFRGKPLTVEELTGSKLQGCGHRPVLRRGRHFPEVRPRRRQGRPVVVDNSSAFRMVDDVPLVIPEINPEAIKKHKGIIANPNCSTIIAITPLWPIHKKNRIVRFIASTYQAASGAGAAAMEELRESDAGVPRRPALPEYRAAAPLRLQPVQPQQQDRPRNRATTRKRPRW